MCLKRLLSLVLAASMIISSVSLLTIAAAEEVKPGNIYAADDFSDSASASDWAISGNGQVSDGTLKGKDGKTFYAYLSEKKEAASWSDYSVEADMTITAADSTGKAVAGVSLRSDSNSWYGGYIMKLSYAEKRVYLYSGKADGSNGLVTLAFADLETIELNKIYHLKLSVAGDNIECRLDGTKVLEYTASAENMAEKSAKKNDAGYPGALVNNGIVVIDNFVVTAYDVIYADIFSSSSSADWKMSGNGQIAAGTMNGKDGKTFYAHLSELEEAASWTDYSVEANVTITATDANGRALAGIVLRSSENSWYGGYMMKISYADKMAYLYSGKADGSNGLVLLASVALDTVELNKDYHLQLSAIGDNLIGYINGIKALEYTADAENMTAKSAKKNDIGYPGVLVNNGVILIDNFAVKTEKAETSEPDPEIPGDTTAFYSDNFDGAELNAEWKVSGNGQISGGTINGKDGKSFYAYLSEKEGATSWADYSVEADVIVNAADSTGKAVAGVALRSSENSWYGGYIMKLSYADQKIYIYSAKADGTSALVNLTSVPFDIELNTTYRLKLIAVGDELAGYVDGVKTVQYTADTENMTAKSAKKNDAGYPGLLVNNGDIAFDNFVVKAETQIPTEPTPDPEPVDPDALYVDRFDVDGLSSVWGASENAQVNSGTLQGKEGKSFYAYLSEKEGAASWADYSVEADMTVTAADSNDRAVAGIALRSLENSWYGGYILKISYTDQKVYLYSARADGTNGLVTLASAPMTIELNAVYHLRISAIGNRLTGYVDGVSVVSYEANEENMSAKAAKKNDAGYPGVLVNNGSVTIDNFAVYPQRDTTGENNASGNENWFYEDFESEEMPVSRGWNTNSVQIYNGGALLTTGQWNLYLTGLKDAMEWSDYSVEADVVFRPDLDTTEGTGTPIAAIVARASGANTGIEFGIASGNAGNYVRLYDRNNGKILATTKNITIVEGMKYHLQMLLVGNTVRGYLNNELVIEYTGNIPAKGTIGIRSGAMSAIFDNVAVKSVSMVNLSDKIVTAPLTGDRYPTSTVMFVFVLSSVTMVLCMAYHAKEYLKNRRNKNGI